MVKTARMLLVFEMLLWPLIIIVFIFKATQLPLPVLVITCILMAVNILLYFLVYKLWYRNEKWIKAVITGFLIANMILTLTDQVGVPDVINVIINMIILVGYWRLHLWRGKYDQNSNTGHQCDEH